MSRVPPTAWTIPSNKQDVGPTTIRLDAALLGPRMPSPEVEHSASRSAVSSFFPFTQTPSLRIGSVPIATSPHTFALAHSGRLSSHWMSPGEALAQWQRTRQARAGQEKSGSTSVKPAVDAWLDVDDAPLGASQGIMQRAEANLFIALYGKSRASREEAMCRVAHDKVENNFSAEQVERLDMLSAGMSALRRYDRDDQHEKASNASQILVSEQGVASSQCQDMPHFLSMEESRVLTIYADKLNETGALDAALCTQVFEIVARGLSWAVGFRARLFQSLMDGIGALPYEDRFNAFSRLTALATTFRERSRANVFPALAKKLCLLRPFETLEAFYLLSCAAAQSNASDRPGQLLALFLKDTLPAFAAWNERESYALSAPFAHLKSFIDAAQCLAPAACAAALLFAAGHIAGSPMMSEAEKLASYKHVIAASQMLALPERIDFFSALTTGAFRRSNANANEELSLLKRLIPELDETAASALSAVFES